MAKYKTKSSVFYDGLLYEAGQDVELPDDLAQPLLDKQALEPIAAPVKQPPAAEPKAKKEG